MPNWSEIRRDFPSLQRYRYFYTASGGPLPRPVYEAAVEYYKKAFEGGDIYWEENLQRREDIRGRAAALIGAQPEEVEFIPSTAVGMNLIAGMLSQEGDVLATTLEFPDTTLPWLHQRESSIVWVEPDPRGAVPVADLLRHSTAETAVIATSHVQYSNGFRQDLAELGNRKGDHILVVNATQSLGAFCIDVARMNIDALCANSYKWMLAGYGCGLLYLSGRIFDHRRPPGVGWFAVQDRDSLRNDRYSLLPGAARFNWGSPSFPAILTLGAAIDYLLQIGMDAIEQRVLELNRYLTDQLQARGYTILSPIQPESYRSAATLVRLRRPEETVARLADEGILCTPKPEGMRVATHFFVSEEDIDCLLEALLRIEGTR